MCDCDLDTQHVYAPTERRFENHGWVHAQLLEKTGLPWHSTPTCKNAKISGTSVEMKVMDCALLI